MVKISYAYYIKQKNVFMFKKSIFFLEREREKNKSPISRILLFHSEIGRRELQTL